MNILIVNDDGPEGKGTLSLVRHLLKEGHKVEVSVPETEQSGKSHGMNFLTPLFVREYQPRDLDIKFHLVSGTPSDAVQAGIQLFCQEKPDLIISGINMGYNAGIAVYYSGTVSAAHEGYISCYSVIAVSAPYFSPDFDMIAEFFVKEMLPCFEPEIKRGERFFYNINFPEGDKKDWKGIKAVTIDRTPYNLRLMERRDPFGRSYYWYGPASCFTNIASTLDDSFNSELSGNKQGSGFDENMEDEFFAKDHKYDESSDMAALNEGYVAITPINPEYEDMPKILQMPDLSSINFDK